MPPAGGGSDNPIVQQTLAQLEKLAPAAVRRLQQTIESPNREDSPGIKAAEAVLDRIGVPREQRLAAGAGLVLPPEAVAALLGGLAKMAGRALSEDQVSTITENLRRVGTSAAPSLPELPPRQQPAVLGGQAQQPPTKPARRKKAAAAAAAAPAGPLNLPTELLEAVEDEDLDHPADKEL